MTPIARRAELAAWLDSYRQNLRDSLHTAARQGFRLVQGNAAAGELSPGALGSSARRHLRKYLADLGARLDGLLIEFPGAGLADRAHGEERIRRLEETLALCGDLKAGRAGVSIGGLGLETPPAEAQEALSIAAGLADRFGVELAIRDPQAPAERLAERVRRIGCPSLRVAVDSAGFAPHAADALAELVGTVHLRDVRRSGERFEETAFGAGEVDFPAVLAALDQAGYRGALVIRRDGAARAVDAMQQGLDYMRLLADRPSVR